MKLAVKDVVHHLSCPAFGRAILDFGFKRVAAVDADYARMMEQIQHSLFKTSAAQKRRLLCRRSRISSVRCRTLNKNAGYQALHLRADAVVSFARTGESRPANTRSHSDHVRPYLFDPRPPNGSAIT